MVALQCHFRMDHPGRFLLADESNQHRPALIDSRGQLDAFRFSGIGTISAQPVEGLFHVSGHRRQCHWLQVVQVDFCHRSVLQGKR